MQYTAKPAPGPITLSLIGKSAEEQNRITCAALEKCFLPNRFSRLGIDVTVLKSQRVNGGLLEVDVAATRNGVPLKTDNPFQFFNPPVSAPDGTFRKGFATKGEPVNLPNETENPLEALQLMIANSILASQ